QPPAEPEPEPEPAPAPEPAAAPDPAPAPSPSMPPEISPPAVAPDPSPAPVPSAPADPQTQTPPPPPPPPAPVASTAPLPMNGKPPLQPATHPQPKTPKAMLVIASVVFGLAVIGGAVAYAEMARPAWIFGTKAGATPTPKPYTLGAEVTPSPEATPTPAPTPDLAVRNAHRQADLAAFAAAYKASAVKGYYPVKPPAVNV